MRSSEHSTRFLHDVVFRLSPGASDREIDIVKRLARQRFFVLLLQCCIAERIILLAQPRSKVSQDLENLNRTAPPSGVFASCFGEVQTVMFPVGIWLGFAAFNATPPGALCLSPPVTEIGWAGRKRALNMLPTCEEDQP